MDHCKSNKGLSRASVFHSHWQSNIFGSKKVHKNGGSVLELNNDEKDIEKDEISK